MTLKSGRAPLASNSIQLADALLNCLRLVNVADFDFHRGPVLLAAELNAGQWDVLAEIRG